MSSLAASIAALTTFIAAVNGLLRLFCRIWLIWRRRGSMLQMLEVFQAEMKDPALHAVIRQAGGQELMNEIARAGDELEKLAKTLSETRAMRKQIKRIAYVASTLARAEREWKIREQRRRARLNTGS